MLLRIRSVQFWTDKESTIYLSVELGRVLINFGKRSSLNVRFALKATELLRRREMTRWAPEPTSRHIRYSVAIGGGGLNRSTQHLEQLAINNDDGLPNRSPKCFQRVPPQPAIPITGFALPTSYHHEISDFSANNRSLPSKGKCCVDRLNPPGKSRHRASLPLSKLDLWVHALALLWQIYSRCFFSLIQDRQYGHR
jgi:hypothetical protein